MRLGLEIHDIHVKVLVKACPLQVYGCSIPSQMDWTQLDSFILVQVHVSFWRLKNQNETIELCVSMS